MPINPDAVGSESEPVETLVDLEGRAALRRRRGRRVGRPAQELQFTTENSQDIDQQVLPTFAVIVGMGGGAHAPRSATFNWAMLVHGEQAIELHGPDPRRGHGAHHVAHHRHLRQGLGRGRRHRGRVGRRGHRQAAVQDPHVGLHPRRGWLGRRPRPVGRHATQPPDRAPDHEVTYETRADQALTYRLSGDRNPLHSDPEFAKLAGFDRPILHGLCTYGFTGRALLHTLCGSDPARFKSHGRPLLEAGHARATPSPSRCGSTATRPSSAPRPRTAKSSSTPASARSADVSGAIQRQHRQAGAQRSSSGPCAEALGGRRVSES